MKYIEACKKAEEYAKENGIRYQKITVLEFEQEWWFSYVPEGDNYTNCIKIAINKMGDLRRVNLTVPPLENLKVFRTGKNIEFIRQ